MTGFADSPGMPSDASRTRECHNALGLTPVVKSLSASDCW